MRKLRLRRRVAITGGKASPVKLSDKGVNELLARAVNPVFIESGRR
jgi:hypothetical protein